METPEEREDRPEGSAPAKHSTAETEDDERDDHDRDAAVEESSMDSYPASDPPAW